MGLSLVDFFGISSRKDCYEEFIFPTTPCLIVGPPRSGKTSFLFQHGFAIASQGKKVLLICKESKFRKSPPLPIGNENLFNKAESEYSLNNIFIKYIDNDKDLRAYLAGIHMNKLIPDVILVDGISEFFKVPSEKLMLRTLAFIKDAADYIHQFKMNKKKTDLNEESCCPYVVSDVFEGNTQALLTIQRWLPLVILIRSLSTLFPLSFQMSLYLRKHNDGTKNIIEYTINKEIIIVTSLEDTQGTGNDSICSTHNIE